MVTSDLGRVTTLYLLILLIKLKNCGDVRSRTSYNSLKEIASTQIKIVVTSDLGRVTTIYLVAHYRSELIVVTSDLGRVTTKCAMLRYFSQHIVVTSDLGRVTTSISYVMTS